MASTLYRLHSAGLAATYAELENHAVSQDRALVGTPGAISLRTNASGARFYVRQYYDHDGRKTDEYIAAQADSPDTRNLVEQWRKRIAEANDAIASVRLLAREGYFTVPRNHLAAIAPLSDFGLFEAGALLVGTHAFEVIANRLGIRVAAFATEDVDIARPARLALDNPPQGGMLELLRASGIDFVEVPSLDRHSQTGKFKERGRSRFTFDLLMPAKGDEVSVEPVPELKTHATALPYLRYLVAESQPGAVLSTHGVAAVRVPLAERFAVHKLMVSRLRVGRPQKSLKDLRQAAALIAALAELHPGAVEDALAKVPASRRADVRKSLEAIQPSLAPHPRALQAIEPFGRLSPRGNS